MTTDVLVVLTTFPAAEPDLADKVALLVEERLAACVNLVSGVRSIYRWQGAVSRDDEVLAVIKTTRERFDALRARLVELHPYDCPEVIALQVRDGHVPYLDWVRDSTLPPG